MFFKKKGITPKEADFTKNNLPSSRKQQIFFLFKNEWKLMILLPLFFLLLFSPYLFIFILNQVWIINNPTKDPFNFNLISEGIKTLCVILPFLGFGGLCEVHRHLSLNEGVLFWKDFIKGFNLKWVLFGLLFGILNLLLVLLSSTGIFYFIVLGLFYIVLYPVNCFAATQTHYYNLKFSGYVSNGVKFAIRYFPQMFLFSLFPLIPRLLAFVPNMPIIIYDTVIAIAILLSPIYAIILYSFCLDKFDENINKTNYPNFYHKGLNTSLLEDENNEIKDD